MTTLDRDELEIFLAFQEDRLERLELSAEEIEVYRKAARETSRKDERVNIRMSSADLQDLRVRAMQEGMPYQTLMASVLHKYVTGRLIER